MSLHIEIEKGSRRTLIVRLAGELDHHSSEIVKQKMEEELLRDNSINVVLSLKDLTFMDSSGLGVILGRYKHITGKGGRMVVCDVHPSVYRLFELSGMFKIITIRDNERQAMSSLEVVS
ncbi:MAG: anti-sigma F factor antagonist [Gorillibacterium sp.]|nr:anti-sigma F factor antagonist [Gorillibacterium sp.]